MMAIENNIESSGTLTDEIKLMLKQREEIMETQEIPIVYVWQIPIVINNTLGFMIDINELLLVNLFQKYDYDTIVHDLSRYVYRKVELEMGFSDEVTIQ